MKLRSLTLTIFLIGSLGLSAQAKPQVIPVMYFELFGGQTNFDGDEGSFLGNGSWSVAPVMQFQNSLMLIPSYSGLVRRTVQVEELIGGALLTQSEQQHNFNLKALHNLGQSNWKLKERVGYNKILIRETNDEGWGDGLFDYDKFVLGFEFERKGQKLRGFRTGLEYFTLMYPNFTSLASDTFGSEIQSGADVLDLWALDWLTSLDVLLAERCFFSYSVLLSPRYYTDANIIQDTGLFSSDKREDFYFWNAANLHHSFNKISIFKPGVGFYLAGILNDSNQNNFDADNVQFNKNYYSYTEYALGPRFDTMIGKKTNFGFSYTFTQRSYADRPVQTQTGLYTGSTIVNEIQNYGTNISYILGKGFKLNGTYAYQVAKSNMKFEQTYQYNYDSSHYFIGVSWEN